MSIREGERMVGSLSLFFLGDHQGREPTAKEQSLVFITMI